MRTGEILASWTMVIPPEQRIAMFNWLRSRLS
jgi:hypothetical protein